MLNHLLYNFKRYLTTLALGAISRKLYTADVARFLHWLQSSSSTNIGEISLDDVKSPHSYSRYLSSLHTQAASPATIRRTIASLRQFGTFLAATHSLPNPTNSLNSTPQSPTNGSQQLLDKYIKLFTEYLKSLHLSPLTIKSYKSDIQRYLNFDHHTTPSSNMKQVLNQKNRQKYLKYLAESQLATSTTIERKDQSLTRFANWYHSVYTSPTLTDNINTVSKPILESNSPHEVVNIPQPAHTSPGTVLPRVKKIYSRINLFPSLGSASFRNFATLLILLVFTSALAVFGYRQFSRDVVLTQAYPSTPVTPNRQLSFQGRLESAGGTPITTATNMVFKLFNASGGGSELYSTGTCSIDPDADGVFSTQIGDTCGSAIASSVFTENQDVWLEVTIGAETLSPRQQIATVAYALNAETLQGFPLSSTVSAIRNTVVPMNQWGEIIVGEQSPRLTGVSGTFAISAPALSITTATGTNGNISLAPDGTGQVNVTGNTTTTNFFNVSNAQLTSGSLITGTAANANTGFKLIDLLSGASPTSKFSVADTGNTTMAGDLTVSGDDIFMATNTSGMLLIADGTNFNPTTVSGDITINGSGTTAIGDDKVTEADLKVVDTASDEECLTYETTTGDFEWQACSTGMSGFTLAGDSGTPQSITDTNTLTIAGGAGITTSAGATDTVTVAFASTELNDLTWGTGANATVTWSSSLSGATDPTLAFSDDLITVGGDLAVNGATSADITSTTTNASIFNTTVDYVALFGYATTVDFATTTPPGGERTINIGGIGNDSIDYVYIASDATSRDVISIGNTHASTTLGLSAGTITLATNSTGNGEVILPNDSVGPNEVFTTGQTDEYCLTYEATGTIWEWQTCAAIAANSLDFTEFKDAMALDASTSIAFDAAEVLTFDAATVDTTTTGGVLDLNVDAGNAAVIAENVDLVQVDGSTAATDAIANQLNLTANDADGDMFGLVISTAATVNAAAGSYEAGIKIDNLENTAGSMTDAIVIAATTDTAITDALDVSDNEIVNAINIGTNLIEGTNFDVATTGHVTVQGGYGLDTNAAGELKLGDTTATTVSLGTTAALTINIGTGTIANTINIGTGGTNADDINIGGLSTSHTDFTGVVNFAGGTTYYVDASGNAKFLDLVVADDGNPGLTVGSATNGEIQISESTITDNNTTFTLNSPYSVITIADDLAITGGNITTATTFDSTATITSTLTANSDVDMVFESTQNLSIAHDLAGTVNVVNIAGTPHASANTTYGLYIDQVDSANGNGFDASLVIDNSDTNLAIATGLLFSDAGGHFTTGIDLSAASGFSTAAISVGANKILGTTGLIDYTDFDFDADGLLVFASDGAGDQITITTPAADFQALVVDGATNDSTQTAGMIDLNVDTSTTTAIAGLSLTLNTIADAGNDTIYGNKIDYIIASDASGIDTVYGEYIGITANDANSVSYGLAVIAEDAGSQIATAGILVDNLQATDIDLTDGILVRATTADSIVDGLDVSDAELTNGINIGANTLLGTTGLIDYDNFDVDASGNITNVSAITADGLLTMSSTAANIALGSNYLSGDGGDEGIFISSLGGTYLTGDVSSATMSAIPATYNNTNILPNPSFEVGVASSGIDGWGVSDTNGATTRISANSHDGLYSLKLNVTSGGSVGSNTILSSLVPVSPSTSYSISTWAKEDSTSCVDGFYLRARWFDNAGVFISNTGVYNDSGAVGTTWTLFHGEVTSPSNAYYAQMSVLNYQPDNACILYVDQVSMRTAIEGNLLVSGSETYATAHIKNTNTTAGDTRLLLESQVGDPYIQFYKANAGGSGSQQWSAGIDQSASNSFIISRNATLGTNDALTIDTSNNITFGANATVTGDLTISGNDITFGNTETISNATNNLILITSATTRTSSNFEVAGTTGITITGAGGDLVFANAESITNDTNGELDLNGQVRVDLNEGTSTEGVCSSGNDTGGGGANALLYDCSGTPAADYAEIYPTQPNVEYGDIVSITSDIALVKRTENITIIEGEFVETPKLGKTSLPYDRDAIGIVSNNYSDFASTGHGIVDDQDHPLPVALNGRVPVKISPSSQPIAVGDPITSSNDPGKGMKATQAGRVVGRALQSWNPSNPTDTVLVFVENDYYDPSLALDANGNLPVIATAEIKTNLISPLAPDQPIEVQAPVVITPPDDSVPALVVEGEILADSISARSAKLDSLEVKDIVADRIFANHIEGLDAKIATLSAHTNIDLSDEELSSLTDRIKDRLSSLTATDAGTAADLPIPPEATASQIPSGAESEVGPPTASDSATLISLDADFVTINQYLAVLGSATITDLTVTQDLFVDKINSQTGVLALQSVGGTVNLASNTLIVDSTGTVAINGAVTVTGALALRPDSTSPLGKLLQVFDEQGLEVGSIDASGSANLADVTTQLITIASGGVATPSGIASETTSNATAGNSVLVSPNTELTIYSPYVTGQTLVYLTPTANTDNKVLFVKSKSDGSFTVAIDAPANSDIPFNWWIIQLSP